MSAPISRQQRLSAKAVRRAALGIAALYLALALAYGVINPLFEAPDEHWHFFTAVYIAEERRLPRVSDPPDPWLGQEAAQPPLYYLLGALIATPFETQNARELVWPNPRVVLGDASAMSNINAFVHGPWEAWPWRGYALAAHAMRAFSSLLGLGALFFLFQSAAILWPDRPQRTLLAMAMAAFLPQFVFIHSAISNDPLITFFASAAIWQLLAHWHGTAQPGRQALLGLTVGLAILSKTAGLLLLFYACAVLLLRGVWRRQPLWNLLWRIVLYVALPALVLGGWLLWRNWSLYGDPTAANQFVAIAGGDRGYGLSDVLAETGSLWTSLFAVFGWFNVRAPHWVYWFWNVTVGLAVAGAVSRWAERRRRAQEGGGRRDDGPVIALWLAGWVLLVCAGLIAFMLRTPAAQGRLLFPALVPLVLGMAYGLDVLMTRLATTAGKIVSADRYVWARLIFPAAALVTSLYGVLMVIPSTYEKPAILPGNALPASDPASGQALGSDLTLLAAELETERAAPGDAVWMTLYWRATAALADRPRDAAPQLVVELFGRGESLVGKYQGYHGRGLYPALLWSEDGIVADRFAVPLTRTMQVPTEVRVQVGQASAGERLTVGVLEAEPVQWPAAPDASLAQLGEAIALLEARLAPEAVAAGETVQVALAWRALQDVQARYTTFVHLGPPSEQPLAQADSPPLGGDYGTGRWQANEVILGDEYELQVPETLLPGRYPVLVGMYEPESGRRLPLFVGGERQEQDAFVVGWLTVQ